MHRLRNKLVHSHNVIHAVACQARMVGHPRPPGTNPGTNPRPHRHSAGGQAWSPASHRIHGALVHSVDKETLAFTDAAALSEASLKQRREALCETGLPDVEMCGLDSADLDEGGPTAAGSGQLGVVDEAMNRGRWLLGLLILQSTSSFVLDHYQALLREHLVVTLFLTMLVGAGGNAGNQSAIKVIRGLATGAIKPTLPSIKKTLAEQASVGLLLGAGLSLGGFVRVFATNGNVVNAASISLSLFLIVMSSVVLGTALPFALNRSGVDPANAGTSIQVVMDILGVAITCVTCNTILMQFASSLPQ